MRKQQEKRDFSYFDILVAAVMRAIVENPHLLEERPELPDLWEKMMEPGRTIRIGR